MSSLGSGPVSGTRVARAVARPAPGLGWPAASGRGTAPARAASRGRVPDRFLAQSEPVAPIGIGGYLIAIVLMAATTAAVLAGGWIGGAQATLLVASVAVVEAILVGRSGLGRSVALLLALPLCAAVVVPTTISLLPTSVSSLGFEHTVGEYIIQAFAGLLSTGPNVFVQWAFIVGLSTIVWLCGYWLGWMAFREHRGVLAVLPALVVLAVNILNAPSITITAGPGSSIGLAETLGVFAAVLVIGLAQLDAVAASWRARRVPTLEGLRGRFLAAVVVTATGVVAASLLIPPITTTDISQDLFNGAGRGPGNGPGAGPATIGFSAIVDPGAPLVNHPAPVLSYYTDQGGAAYLAAVDDTLFADGDWSPDFTAGSAQPLEGGLIPRDQASLGGSRSTVTLDVTYASSAAAATTGSDGGLALFPGDPSSISHYGVVIGLNGSSMVGAPPTPTLSPTHVAASTSPTGQPCIGVCPGAVITSGNFLTVQEVDLESGRVTSLQTAGLVSTATVAQLEAAGTDYPSWVVTQDDAPLAPKGSAAETQTEARAITQLARQWTAGTTNAYDAASAIESHLRLDFAYTLTPRKGPAGEWPIVYFLETSHEGYCQYFAGAMGAMLRSLGIPAMLVSGYGPGTATGHFTAAHQTIYGVTTTDAHVWVEAYFPGYGWIPFEPTPSSTFGGYVPFSRGGVTPPPSTASASSRTPLPRARPSAPVLPTQSAGGATGVPRWEIGLPIGLAAAAVLILASLAWWRRPRSLAGVWRRLALAARLAGLDHDPAETRTAFAARLSRALGGGGPPVLRTELGTVAAVTGKAEFSPQGLDDDDRGRWRSAWTVLARDMARALRRRLLRRRPAV